LGKEGEKHMTEEDEAFAIIERRQREYLENPRWKDHTKECPNCAKMEEDMAILMARLERALQEKTK
jgi:hypothetical protein